MGGNCPQRLDLPFLKFVWNFNKTHRSRYYALLSEATDKTVVILRSRKEARQFLLRVQG